MEPVVSKVIRISRVFIAFSLPSLVAVLLVFFVIFVIQYGKKLKNNLYINTENHNRPGIVGFMSILHLVDECSHNFFIDAFQILLHGECIFLKKITMILHILFVFNNEEFKLIVHLKLFLNGHTFDSLFILSLPIGHHNTDSDSTALGTNIVTKCGCCMNTNHASNHFFEQTKSAIAINPELILFVNSSIHNLATTMPRTARRTNRTSFVLLEDFFGRRNVRVKQFAIFGNESNNIVVHACLPSPSHPFFNRRIKGVNIPTIQPSRIRFLNLVEAVINRVPCTEDSASVRKGVAVQLTV